jgi:hypothetical protein
MFRIDMLPANYGDCLWIEYGDPARPTRILIDGGTANTFPEIESRIREVVAQEKECRFELFIVTHVDADHIGGALRLLKAYANLGVTFDDIWFNGYRHILEVSKSQDKLGVRGGERLSRMIDGALPWNQWFNGRAVVVGGQQLPRITLEGGMQLTVLSPTSALLARLEDEWESVAEEAEKDVPKKEELPLDALGTERPDVERLVASAFTSDDAVANGTSISLLAEFDNKRLFLGADAYAPALQESLARFAASRPTIDAFKIPHHGSRSNLSADLVEAMRCDKFLISTNGVKFKHPHSETIARIVKKSGGANLYFNYRTRFNEMWNDADLKSKYDYETFYEKDGRRVTLVP